MELLRTHGDPRKSTEIQANPWKSFALTRVKFLEILGNPRLCECSRLVIGVEQLGSAGLGSDFIKICSLILRGF